jgi:hypothetical protein
MSDVKGFDGKLAVSTDNITYTDIGGMTQASISIGHSLIDTSDWDVGWTTNLVGRGSITLSFTHNYDEADAGQDIVRTASEQGTQIYYRYRPMGDVSTQKEFIMQGTLESYDDTSPNDDKVESSGSVTSTGAPTIQAQP